MYQAPTSARDIRPYCLFMRVWSTAALLLLLFFFFFHLRFFYVGVPYAELLPRTAQLTTYIFSANEASFLLLEATTTSNCAYLLPTAYCLC